MEVSQHIKKIGILLLASMLAVFTAATFASAQVNPEINYQGKLTDTSDAAVADGVYIMRFRLYDALTGGTLIDEDDRETALGDRITVTNGLFSVLVGSSTAMDLTAVDFNQTLYLEVLVGTSTASGLQTLTPRKKLGTVPAAFYASDAGTVGGVASTSLLRSDEADTISASASATLLTIDQTGAGDILNILDSGASVFTVINGGNVGIGTTTPGSLLTVDGSFAVGTNGTEFAINSSGVITAGTWNGTTIAIANGGTGTTTSQAGGILFSDGTTFKQDTPNFFWDDTNNRLGIGTTSPLDELSITYNNETGNNPAISINTSAASNGQATLGFRNNDTLQSYIRGGDGSANLVLATVGNSGLGDIHLRAGDDVTTDLIIDGATGNVGIGTLTPVANLHVRQGLVIPTLSTSGATMMLSEDTPQLVFDETDGAADNQLWDLIVVGGQFRGRAVNDADSLASSWIEVDRTGITIDQVVFPNGNVGIDNTSPTNKLTIGSALNASLPNPADLAVQIGSQGEGEEVALKLYVQEGTNNRRVKFFLDDADGTYGFDASAGSVVPDFVINSVNAGESFRVTAGGNIGIGTTSPYAKLSVVGETVSEYFTATSTTATSYFGGSVGIGTTSPTEQLSVANRLYVGGTGTSTFENNLQILGQLQIGTGSIYLRDNATSTFAGGIDISAGCFSINGSCVGGAGSGSGTVGSGMAGQFPYYAANGTALTATSSLFLATSGNVGIGTAAPATRLHVATDATAGEQTALRLSHAGSAVADDIALEFLPASGTISVPAKITGIAPGSSDVDLAFTVVNGGTQSEIMRIVGDTGNVGIGTTSPDFPLHIYGTNPRATVQGTGLGSNIAYRLEGLSANGTVRKAGYYLEPGDTTATTYLGISADDTTYQMVVNTDGNVGIGTTSIATNLNNTSGSDLGGRVFQLESTTAANFIIQGPDRAQILLSDTNATSNSRMFGIKSEANVFKIYSINDDLTINTDNILVATSGGNVGIGTTTPDVRLSITGGSSSSADEDILRLETTGENGSSIQFQNGLGDLSKITGTKAGGGALSNEGVIIFETATNSVLSEAMRIDYTGNVGIGTTTPAAQLVLSRNYTNGSVNTGLQVDAGNLSETVSGSGLGIDFTNQNGSIAGVGFYANGTSNGLGLWGSTFTGAPELYVANGGNVGIGTTTPGTKLQITGGSSNTADEDILRLVTTGENGSSIQFQNGLGDLSKITGTKAGGGVLSNEGVIIFETATNSVLSEAMRIDYTGNVGIGSTSPSDKLVVGGALRFSEDISFNGDKPGRIGRQTDNGLTITGVTGSGNDFTLATPTGSLLIANPTGTINLALNPTSGGNVGIGTTTPGSLLTVDGSFAVGTNGTEFTINSSGVITAGTWNATDIAVADGGTGASTAAGARTNLGLVIGTDVQAEDPVLTDLSALAVIADNEIMVGTGAGTYANESGATLRTSIGVDAAGTDNSTNVTLSGSRNYITLSGQDIVRGVIDISDDTNLAGGTNITLSNDTLNVDDVFLLNTGDTATGNYTFDTNTLFIDALNNRVGVGKSTAPGAKFEVEVADVDNTIGILIDMNETGSFNALFVDSEASGAAVQINGYQGLAITPDITNGYGIQVLRNLAEAGASPLVNFIDDNTSNTQTVLRVQQDGTGDIVNFFDGTTEAFTILNGGNVGIGTAAPTTALDVAGTIGARRLLGFISNAETAFPSAAYPVLYSTANTGLSYPFQGAGNLVLQSRTSGTSDIVFVGNTTPDVQMVIQGATGNVGIGTTTPATRLQITGGSSPDTDEDILRLKTGGENGSSIQFQNVFGDLSKITGTKAGGGVGADNGVIIFETAIDSVLSEAMRIDDAGNVGIGTTSIATNLNNTAGANLGGQVFQLESTSASNLIIQGPDRAQILLSDTNATSNSRMFGIKSEGDVFKIYSITDVLGTNTDNIFVATASGNVGIGTAAPNAKLEVVGATLSGIADATTGGLQFAGRYSGLNLLNTYGSERSSGATVIGYAVKPSNVGAGFFSSAGNASFARGALILDSELEYFSTTSSTIAIDDTVNMVSRFKITSAGNVGIGTATPGNILTIGGASNKSIEVISGTSNAIYMGAFNDATFISANRDNSNGTFADATKAAAEIYLTSNAGDSNIAFGTNTVNNATPVERLRITASGNVGIGTTTPDTALAVVGALQVSTSGSTYGNALRVETSGRVFVPSIAAGTGSNPLCFTTSTGEITTGNGSSCTNGGGSGGWTDGGTDVYLNTLTDQVGIGTNSPTEALHLLSSATDEPKLRMENTNTDATASTLVFVKNGGNGTNSDRLGTLDFVGNDSVGNVETYFSIRADSLDVTNGSEDGRLTFYTRANGAAIGGSTQRALQIASSTIFLPNAAQTGENDSACFIASTGELVMINATTCSASSQKYKENIKNLEYGIEELMKLRPVSFQYTEEYDPNDRGTKIGYIAEEMELVIPEVVYYEEDGISPRGINYEWITSLNTAGIQEQQGMIEGIQDALLAYGILDEKISGGALAGGDDAAFWELDSETGSITYFGVLDMNGFDINNVRAITSASGAWSIDEEGRLTVAEVQTEKLCIGDTCITESQLKDLLAGGVLSGEESGEGTGSGSEGDSNDADTEAPVITLNGNNPATIKLNMVYSDLGATVSDNVNENLGYKTFVDGVFAEGGVVSIDTSTTTTYVITYNATDGAGNTASTTRDVTVYDPFINEEGVPEEEVVEEEADTEAPVITLMGDASIALTVGDSYTDAGATALDNIDGDITTEIILDGAVDTATEGEYTLTYNATDEAGNTAVEVTRTVTVSAPVPPADTEAPVITLIGDASITLTVGDSYTDAGATAEDNIDGDITASIATSGSVDTGTAGEYTLTYNVTDEAGNTAVEVTRTVVVEDAPIEEGGE